MFVYVPWSLGSPVSQVASSGVSDLCPWRPTPVTRQRSANDAGRVGSRAMPEAFPSLKEPCYTDASYHSSTDGFKRYDDRAGTCNKRCMYISRVAVRM